MQGNTYNGLTITEVRCNPRYNKDNPRMLAMCSVTFNGCIAVRNVRLIQGGDGCRFVAMPQRLVKTWDDPDGELRDVAFPINNEAREWLHGVLFGVYDQITAGGPVREEAA